MNKLLVGGSIVSLCFFLCSAAPPEVSDAIKVIRAVGPEGQGNVEAAAAWKKLAQGNASQIPMILAGMDGADELIANWLRAAVDAIVSRELSANGKLPTADLLKFIEDTQHNPRARRLAYELIARLEPKTAEKLLSGMLDDPSLELRRDAVQQVVAQAAKLQTTNKQGAVEKYRVALRSARDLDQIRDLTKKLRDLGETVDLAKLFGFLTHWKIIGPFDNTGGKGFAEVFPPEKKIDLAAEYDGKTAKVKWVDHTTTHEYAMVDLNPVCGALKGVTGYAYTEFVSDKARPAELRLGLKNAWKVWLNGKLLFEREEYHRGMQMDQYRLQGQLKPGANTILVKLCQNELVEKWTVEWQFQLRVCDHLGTAIYPATAAK